MRVVRLLTQPGWLAVIVVVVSVVVVEQSPAGVAAGLAGAVAGFFAILAAGQVGLLAGVPLAGMRVKRIVFGIGPRLADWSTPERAVSVRLIPIFLSVGVRARRPPVRRRLWWSTLCSAVAELALVVAVALRADDAGAFGRGFAIACVAEFVHALLPQRSAAGTSTGWQLFRLPWLRGAELRRLEASPMIGDAIDAARRGDLATADRLAADLREHCADLPSALAARVLVLEARGRYPEAMVLAVKLAADARQTPGEAAGSFAALAGITCVTVEAGLLDAELGLSTASQALDDAATLGYPAYKLNGVRALLELLRGDTAKAVVLAKLATSSGDDVLVRADDLATLARAHMAAGDNRAAREVLTEAEKLASWWPRVATTRSRLEVA